MIKVFVTGAAGFIGSAVCRYLRSQNVAQVTGIDKMTYAASRESLSLLDNDPGFRLIEADISDESTMARILKEEKPDGIFHLAAETHVDRSIDSPYDFVHNNIVGTFVLLECIRHYLSHDVSEKKSAFRFLYVSTDEVYGSLGNEGKFTEKTPVAPNSPYAASKAGADHFVRAWHKTYGLPVLTSHCSNNYGPFQFPEKLIPLCIMKALNGEPLPIYGQGHNVRDWLYVEDHVEALCTIFLKGQVGETYNIGGAQERRNIDLVRSLCDLLDDMMPQSALRPHHKLITFVADRPGHDERYAMDFSKLERELKWKPRYSLEEGLRKTVRWYLDNQDWCRAIRERRYDGERLGLARTEQR